MSQVVVVIIAGIDGQTEPVMGRKAIAQTDELIKARYARKELRRNAHSVLKRPTQLSCSHVVTAGYPINLGCRALQQLQGDRVTCGHLAVAPLVIPQKPEFRGADHLTGIFRILNFSDECGKVRWENRLRIKIGIGQFMYRETGQDMERTGLKLDLIDTEVASPLPQGRPRWLTDQRRTRFASQLWGPQRSDPFRIAAIKRQGRRRTRPIRFGGDGLRRLKGKPDDLVLAYQPG